jgi:hypothetical protein
LKNAYKENGLILLGIVKRKLGTSDFQKFMGVRDVTDIPPFIINTSSDMSDSEDDFGLIEDESGSESNEEEIIVMVVDDLE